MKRGDFVWVAVFAAAGLMLALPGPGGRLQTLAAGHRYLTGFMSFALMGVLAEAIRDRFSGRGYPERSELVFLALTWGLHGLAAALLFWLVNAGVVMSQTVGLLPGGGFGRASSQIRAILTSFFFTGPFFTSLFLNLSFIPVLLAAQRLGRAAFQLRRREGRRPSLTRASEAADWADFIRSEVPAAFLFRLPYLTLVLMLPSDLWLILAALGLVGTAVLAGLSRRRAASEQEAGPEAGRKYSRRPGQNSRPGPKRPRVFFSPPVKKPLPASRPEGGRGRPSLRARKSAKRPRGMDRPENI